MIVGPATKRRPQQLPIGFFDGVFVDAGYATLHQPLTIEFPIFVAVGAEPGPAFVMEFVGERTAMRLLANAHSSFTSR